MVDGLVFDAAVVEPTVVVADADALAEPDDVPPSSSSSLIVPLSPPETGSESSQPPPTITPPKNNPNHVERMSTRVDYSCHSMMTFRGQSWLLLAGLALSSTPSLGGCSNEADPGPAAGTSSGTSSPTTAPLPSTGSTDPAPTSSTSDGADASTSVPPDDDAEGAECSVYDQDCPMGEKCVPWSDQPDLVPDDIRCCPVVGGEGLQAGDTCTVEDYFGSCLDDCDVGNFCMDLDGDGEGVCQPMCTGDANDPLCQTNESCLIYFAGVPLCFSTCDPLLQDCAEGNGCYPDEQSAGGTGFICLPTIGTTGDFNENCWLLSNCLPGFICVTPDFLPDCNGLVGCCTPLCDAAEADACDQFSPELECVSWYFGGQTPPSVTLEDVGACALPP